MYYMTDYGAVICLIAWLNICILLCILYSCLRAGVSSSRHYIHIFSVSIRTFVPAQKVN